jgi:hypothetical protein
MQKGWTFVRTWESSDVLTTRCDDKRCPDDKM